MANDVRVNIDVTDNGSTAKLTKEALKLKAGYEGAAAAARTPYATQAAQAGVAKKSTAQPGTASDTNLSRGIGGQTGASGRDFAAQAQGLGGLVHVYATFAANLFAVSAAFSALSKAADMSNMIKGLDQIGAESGRSLGSLAKQLTVVTDGAISLKEALTASSLAAAGGMSNQAILRMGLVAKQASLALGRDLPDSMERLSKGIVKTQPELLDELGIMTKVIPAQQDYARAMGKSVSALTEFEKKQAFANAVLTEGEKKFGSIDLPANNYSKILASMSNLAFTGLEKVNTILGPIVGLLSTSPTALGGAMAAVAGILLKQALPALTQWREGLIKTAETSAATAKKLADTHLEFQINKSIGLAAAVTAPMERIASQGIADIQTVLAKNLPATSKLIKNAMSDGFDLSKEIPKYSSAVTRMGNELTALNTLRNTTNTVDTARLADIDKEIAAISARKLALSDMIPGAQRTLVLQQDITKEMDRQHANIENIVPKYWSMEAALKRISDRAAQSSMKAGVLANVGTNTQIMGIKDALTTMHMEIKHGTDNWKQYQEGAITKEQLDKTSSGMTNLTKASTYASGGIKAVGGAMLTMASSLSNVFMVVTMAVAVFEILDKYFSGTAKTAIVFATSMSNVSDAVANAERTIAAIGTKDPLEFLSTKSMQARATALNELTDAAVASVKSFSMLRNTMTGWDEKWDIIKGWVGAGSKDKLAAALTGTLQQAMKLTVSGPAKDDFIKSMNTLLSPEKLDKEGWAKAVQSLVASGSDVELEKFDTILNKLNIDLNNAAAKGTAFSESLVGLKLAYSTLLASFTPSDNISKFGIAQIDSATKLSDALDNPTTAIKKLQELMKPENMKMLPIDAVTSLQKYGKEITDVGNKMSHNEALINELTTAIDVLHSTEIASATDIIKTQGEEVANKVMGERALMADTLTKNLEDAKKAQDELSKSGTVKSLQETGAGIVTAVFQSGVKFLSEALLKASESAALNLTKSAVQGISGTGMAALNTKLQVEEISIQERAIRSQGDLILSQEKLRVSNELIQQKNELVAEKALRAAMDYTTSSEVKAASDTKIASLTAATSEVPGKLGPLPRAAAALSEITTGNLTELFNTYKDLVGVDGMQVAKIIGAPVAALQGIMAQLTQIGGQKAVAIFQGVLATIKETAEVKNKLTNQQIDELATAIKLKEAMSSYNVIFDEGLAKSIQRNKEEKSTLEIKVDQQNIASWEEETLKRIKVLKDQGKTTDAKTLAGAAGETTTAMKAALTKKQEETSLKNILDRYDIDKNIVAEQERLLAITRVREDREATISNIKTESDKSTLAYLDSMYTLNKQVLAERNAQLDTAKLDREYQLTSLRLRQDAEMEIGKIRTAETVKLQIAQQTYKPGTTAYDTIAGRISGSATAQIAEVNVSKNGAQAVADATRTSGLLAIEQTKNLAIETDKVNEKLKQQASLVASLSAIFGDLGTSMGSVVTSFIEMTDSQEKLTKGYEAQKKGVTDKTQLDKLDAKYQKESLSNSLESTAKIAGATKKMFAEHTIAYKVLGGIEKAAHMVSIALILKEQGIKIDAYITEAATAGMTEIQKTTFAEAGFLTRLPTYIKGIYASWGAMGPWMVGAAALFIASMLGGSGSSSPPAGFTAEEQQKVQGTGQYYKDGKLVNTTGGALGDATKKSTSLEDSITATSAYTKSTMEYNNKMLVALLAIKTNTENFAKSLAHIPGITTQPDTISGGNWLTGNTSTETLDKGITAAGTVGGFRIGQGTLSQYTNTKSSSSGFLGLFGGGTSYNTGTSNIPANVGAKLMDAMAGMFSGIYDALGAAAETLSGQTTAKGKSDFAKAAKDVMDTVTIDPAQFKLSTMGLKGTELSDAVAALIGEAMDQAAAAAFPQLDKFRNLGEGMAATVARMARETDVVNLQLESMGKTLTQFIEIGAHASVAQLQTANDAQTLVDNLKKAGTDMQGFGYDQQDPTKVKALADAEQALAYARAEVTRANTGNTTTNLEVIDSLVKLAGGLDAFNTKSQYFIDNFLTEAEKLAPVQARVSAEMARLKLSSVTTVIGFKDIVKELDLTIPAQQETYTALMNVAEGFYTVYGAATAASKALNAADLEAAQRSQAIELMTAQGYANTAMMMSREDKIKELNAQDPTGGLAITQLKIDTQNDLNKTGSLNLELLNATGKSLDALSVTRANELKALSASDAIIKQATYDAQDKAKTDSLQLELLNAQVAVTKDVTKSAQLLNLTRTNELSTLSASDKLIKQQIYNAQDANILLAEAANLQDQLDSIQMDSIQLRNKERLAISATNQALFDSVTAAQSAAAAFSSLQGLDNTKFDLQNTLITSRAGIGTGTAEQLSAAETIRIRIREKTLAELTATVDKTTEAGKADIAKITSAYDINEELKKQIAAQDAANVAAQAAADAAKLAAEEAASASKAIKDAWQSITDSIFEEVNRIRNLLGVNTAQSLAQAQAKFYATSAQAKAGDQEAAKLLPALSQALLTIAESSATTSLDLKRIQSQTASSLESTGTALTSAYGLTIPKFAAGTDYVPQDMIAMIHQGEKITPKAFNNDDLINEVRRMNAQLAELLRSNGSIDANTLKTAKTLTRVTQGGDAMILDTTGTGTVLVL